MTRGSPTGLTNSVREIVRRVFGGGREFALSAVLDISDVESIRFPAYENQAARDGAIRRMLQDERRHCGLVFVPGRRGVYCYPEIVLDSFRAPGVNSIMSYEAVVESLRAVAQCGRGGRKHVFAILEREGGVSAVKQLDPAHYDRVGRAARKFLVGWGVELDPPKVKAAKVATTTTRSRRRTHGAALKRLYAELRAMGETK